MKGVHTFSKKEKTLFWSAVLIGLVSGIMGNLFASILWQSLVSLAGTKWWSYLLIVIIITLAFLYLLKFISKQIEKNKPFRRK